MKNRIRVLEVINDAAIGGGQMHVLELASGLDRARFDVHAACPDRGFLADRLRERGIPVHDILIGKRPRIGSLRTLELVLRRGRFHIVHAHGGVAGFWARLAAMRAGTPVRVYSLHGIHYLNYPNTLLRAAFIAVDRFLANWTDGIICVSEADHKAGLCAGCLDRNKSLVIKNGIAFPSLPPKFDPKKKKAELGIPANARVVGTVGRLHFQKGQRHLLNALPKVFENAAGVHALLVGDGPMRDELQRLASDLGINGRVHFAGSRRDLAECIGAMDVFVLPSEWEGISLSLLEAMVLERPVVAHSMVGITEAIEDRRSGILVPQHRPDAMANAILRLLNDGALAKRLTAQARRTVLAEFGLGKMTRELAALYRRLSERKKVGPCAPR